MKWFRHDSDASIDAKLQSLMLDYGAKGYGLYWYCVELIAQGVSENNITFELEHDARIIARNLNLTAQETTDMMEKMIELGLFSMTQNHKLACYSLAKRLDQSMTSSPSFRAIIKNAKENHDVVMIKSDKIMQEEKRLDKKRLDKNNKKFTFSLTKKTQYKNLSDEYKKQLHIYALIKNQALHLNKFIDYNLSNGRSYVDWSRAYNTWVANDYDKIGHINPLELKNHLIGGVEYFGYMSSEYFIPADKSDLMRITITETAQKPTNNTFDDESIDPSILKAIGGKIEKI